MSSTPFLGRAASSDNGIPNRGPAVLVVTIIMISCATAFVAMRMISRIGIVKRVAADDYFILLAWVSSHMDRGQLT